MSSDRLLDYFEKDLEASMIGQSILRIYGGIHEQMTTIDLPFLMRKTGVHEEKILQILERMESLQCLQMELNRSDASVTYLCPREDERTLNPHRKQIERQYQLKEQQLERMIEFANQHNSCLSQYLMSYFGDEQGKPCGKCSVCLGRIEDRDKYPPSDLITELKTLLKDSPLDIHGIRERLNFEPQQILDVLDHLTDLGQLSRDEQQRFQFKK
ncbi:RecQ family zinc-binding domain-containing protein [Aureitalea marina]|uniref:RecQ family zinc-binding domain-containing protein n=1 Tax=Aureitalea marina TaxID=930804 RepID=UPI000CF247B1|nr:RecQ family zinc-binding domain-containing protein [Aureitalea marina]